MNRATAVLIILTIFSSITACGSPAGTKIQRQKNLAETHTNRYSAREFFKTTSISGSSINYDNSAVLVTDDSSGVYNVYRYPVDGTEPTRLTHSNNHGNHAVSWFPDDDRILFTADQGGNELDHLYVLEPGDSEQDLTPGENHKARFMGWKDDGQTFYVATNERDFKSFDLYAYRSKDYQRTLVFKNTYSLRIDSVSPDGNWLALVQPNSNADSDIYLVELKNQDKTPELITKHDGSVRFTVFTYTPDSSKLIYGTNENTEYQQAWAYDLSIKQKSPIFKANWDVSSVRYSPRGRFRVIGINAAAQTQTDIIDTQTKKSVHIANLPAGNIHSVNFSDDEKLLAFYLSADNSPANLYVYRLGDKRIRQLSNTLNKNISKTDLVTSRVVTFDSFDGVSIPGLLYKPLQASASNKVPALIMIHGGPGGQSRKGYNPMVQHLVNHGYAIFAVNNRGSSGYGKTFFHLDDKRHGEDDLRDIVFGKKYLQSLNWVDPNKIGVLGKSYGGYLTMAAMTFTEEFEVGVNLYGVTNWVRTLNSIPPWLESFRKVVYTEMGDPAIDAERHQRISPLFHAEKIRKPVLIIQGANDPRVLQIESDELVAEIRKNGVFVDYVLFGDEGHGLRKKANRIAASEALLDFLDAHLSK